MDCNVAMDILDTISLDMSMTYLKVFVFRYTGEVVGGFVQALRSKLKTVLVLAISSLCSAVSGSLPGSESALSSTLTVSEQTDS